MIFASLILYHLFLHASLCCVHNIYAQKPFMYNVNRKLPCMSSHVLRILRVRRIVWIQGKGASSCPCVHSKSPSMYTPCVQPNYFSLTVHATQKHCFVLCVRELPTTLCLASLSAVVLVINRNHTHVMTSLHTFNSYHVSWSNTWAYQCKSKPVHLVDWANICGHLIRPRDIPVVVQGLHLYVYQLPNTKSTIVSCT